MLDKQGIYSRFIEFYPTETLSELGRLFGIGHSAPYQWDAGTRPVPWRRLKALVDEQDLSWDWLIDGSGPMRRSRARKAVDGQFDRHGINERFLSLFPGLSQAKVGKELGVNQSTVFKWQHDMAQVPWERLKYAVDTKGVTWNWLIEGER